MAVEMSLDDIIAMNRKLKQNKTGAQRGNRGGNGGRRNAAPPRRPNYRDLDAPEGNGFHQKPAASLGSNPNKIVRINLANLAASVVSADLEELFAAYNVDTATVHYNEHGESLGTGDVFLKRKDATRAMKEFAGVALDGEIMRMVLVDGTSQNTALRVEFPRRGNTGGIQRRHNNNNRGSAPRQDNRQRRQGGGGGGNRTKQPQKTVEELDAELDAYMTKPKA